MKSTDLQIDADGGKQKLKDPSMRGVAEVQVIFRELSMSAQNTMTGIGLLADAISAFSKSRLEEGVRLCREALEKLEGLETEAKPRYPECGSLAVNHTWFPSCDKYECKDCGEITVEMRV